ncbi:MAG: MFS transporter [Symbiobacteriia bacterium]
MRELLRNRRFTLIWGGQSVSAFGDWVRNMALTYWVYEISGHSPVATSAVMIAEYLPVLILAPLVGVFVDRWSRRRTMFWTQVIAAGLSLSFLAALGLRSLPLALVIAFLGSLNSQFYNPARGAIISVIVQRDSLVAANSLSQVTSNLALVLGPMVGTAVYFAVGPTWSFGIDAASFMLSALAILLAALPQNVGVAGGGGPAAVLRQWREGFTYVRRSRPVRTVLLASFVTMLGGGAANVCDLYLVTRNLHLPESSLSLVMATQGVASIVASLLMVVIARRLNSSMLFWAGLVVLGVGAGAIGLAPNLLWVLIWTGVAGIGVSMYSVGQGTLLQTLVPAELRGRVFAVLAPVIVAALLVGASLGGVLARGLDVRLIIGGTGLISLVGALAAYLGLRPSAGQAVEEAAASAGGAS